MTNKELINLICPDHNRTSCSDDNIINGFYINEEDKSINPKYHIRCSRCALLEIENGTVELIEDNINIIPKSLNI